MKKKIFTIVMIVLTILCAVLTAFAIQPPIAEGTTSLYAGSSNLTATDAQAVIDYVNMLDNLNYFQFGEFVIVGRAGSTTRLYMATGTASVSISDGDVVITPGSSNNPMVNYNFVDGGIRAYAYNYGNQWSVTIPETQVLLYMADGEIIVNDSYIYGTSTSAVFQATVAEWRTYYDKVYNYDDNIADAYDQGDTNGYERGEQAGYDRGYSNGSEDGYETGLADGYETGYDEGLQDGYETGVVDGRQEGYSDGYTSGVTEGRQEGYETGYADGLEDGYETGYASGYQDGEDDHAEDYQNGYEDGKTAGVYEGYETGYAEGMEDGYETGYDEGLEDGYETGYEVGLEDGYETGYADGLEAGGGGSSEPVYEFSIRYCNGSLSSADVLLYLYWDGSDLSTLTWSEADKFPSGYSFYTTTANFTKSEVDAPSSIHLAIPQEIKNRFPGLGYGYVTIDQNTSLFRNATCYVFAGTYEAGYTRGFEDGADILTGLGTVAAAPVNALRQGLDFEIFGINIGVIVIGIIAILVTFVAWHFIRKILPV